MDLKDFYDEHAAQARQHEDQRERMTNIMLSVAGILIGLITFAELSVWSSPASASLILLGLFGYIFAGKHYERFRFHTTIMEAIRDEMDRVANQPATKAKAFSTLRDEGKIRHYDKFRWPFSPSTDPLQANGKSWIARQRLYVFWGAVHLLIVLIGIALCITIGIKAMRKAEDKPIKVEVVGGAWAPNSYEAPGGQGVDGPQ